MSLYSCLPQNLDLVWTIWLRHNDEFGLVRCFPQIIKHTRYALHCSSERSDITRPEQHSRLNHLRGHKHHVREDQKMEQSNRHFNAIDAG
jgi:hypothetical protein